MLRSPETEKLPVPGPWQARVRVAMEDLTSRLELPLHSVTVTRVDASEWSQAGHAEDPGRGLEIWLMAGGRTYRYRAADGSETVERDPAGG